MSQDRKYTILIVEDSESDRGAYRRYLLAARDFKYQILEAETLEEGLAQWRSQSPDLVLVDVNLPDGSGLELLEIIKKTYSKQKFPVIVTTGRGDERIAVQAMKLEVSDYLVKDDITASRLCHCVENAINQYHLSGKLTQLRQQLASHNSALKVKKDFFRTIFDNTFQLIWLLAPEGTVLEANQTALTLGALRQEEVVGRPFWETGWFQISPDTQKQLKESVARAAQGEFIRHEMDIWGANQTVMAIDFSLSPMLEPV